MCSVPASTGGCIILQFFFARDSTLRYAAHRHKRICNAEQCTYTVRTSRAINLSSSSDQTACQQLRSFKSLYIGGGDSRCIVSTSGIRISRYTVSPFGKQRLYARCFTSNNIVTSYTENGKFRLQGCLGTKPKHTSLRNRN